MTTYPNLYVIAGGWEEYEKFKNNCLYSDRYPNHKFVYVIDAYTFRGQENPDGIFIGTWYNRSDIDDIMIALLACIRKDENSAKDNGLRTAIKFLHTKRGPTRIDGKTV